MTVAGPPLPRDQFPIAADVTYLNTALMSPLPVAAVDAMAADAALASRRASAAYDERMATAADVRRRAAALLGVAVDDVAFTRNTTQGLGVVASGLDWREGDRVLLAAGDHPSTELPWRAQVERGVTIDRVPAQGPGGALPLDAFATALDAGGGRVRVVAVSWVQAHHGWRTDLAGLAVLAHEHGALLCVDAIQGLGVLPAALGAWGVDAAAAGAQKWLLGPHGIGLLAVAPELRERLRVAAPSLGSVADDGSGDGMPTFVASARRYEGGALDHSGLAGLGAGLDLLAGAGVEAVWDWVDHLADRLAVGLAAAGATLLSSRGEGRSALVAVTVPDRGASDVMAALAAAGVVVAARGDGVRFSPHGWNTEAEVDAAVAAVASL